MKKESSLKKIRIKKGIYVLPNLITTASLFSGFFSIIASLKENFVIAAIAVLVAAVFDGLDGRIARVTNTTSKFGAEYDSLSDVIAFGVAPAFLAYNWALSFYGRWGWIAAFLFVVCGALRLARYNIQIGVVESRVFNGLPIPSAAAVVATTVLFFDYAGVEGKFHDPSMLIFVPVLSILMVSNVKYYSFKDLHLFARKPFMTFFSLVLVLIILAAIPPQISIFVAMVGYALSGPIWWMFKFGRQKHQKAKEIRADARKRKS
ncbi:MAG TPA: CDP-diacylglycerol--serine O-phosphatidyltransferase [Smithellaceae bacterium]|nr:CDP-diacylglycerol--serine O-phosphatidyltransferase [Smithellaceae bacterium]HRS89614.1 CDP-diacylglycerol--serine O-phosphatidyltransferase [Smithellaceae bacterium]HRV25830.1 CDP-diacylglycerol--serine O-phosphatidyltransferase [Smithellaceae bacterium]